MWRYWLPVGGSLNSAKETSTPTPSSGLASLAKSASFAVVDLDLNLRLQPQRYRRLLHDIFERLIDGDLQMLPVTEFSLDNAIDAFRLIASGTHVGKIIISIPADGRVPAVAPPPAQPPVWRDGGYIVVGGMGGLGFVVARWLAQQGAGMVVLNGRSSPSAEVAAAIAEMHAAGSRVEVITGDIAEPGTAVRLVARGADAGLRPAGVLHSATVLADEIVLNMSQSAAARVFAPKVAGHWWLHQATAHLDLDWWLTFSSAASLLGSPGQGAYAAANSWVDGLVAYRRSRGLPAIGIDWGPWAEVGRAQFFADLGFSMITPELDCPRCNRCWPPTAAAPECLVSMPGNGSNPSPPPRDHRCSPRWPNRPPPSGAAAAGSAPNSTPPSPPSAQPGSPWRSPPRSRAFVAPPNHWITTGPWNRSDWTR